MSDSSSRLCNYTQRRDGESRVIIGGYVPYTHVCLPCSFMLFWVNAGAFLIMREVAHVVMMERNTVRLGVYRRG